MYSTLLIFRVGFNTYCKIAHGETFSVLLGKHCWACLVWSDSNQDFKGLVRFICATWCALKQRLFVELSLSGRTLVSSARLIRAELSVGVQLKASQRQTAERLICRLSPAWIAHNFTDGVLLVQSQHQRRAGKLTLPTCALQCIPHLFALGVAAAAAARHFLMKSPDYFSSSHSFMFNDTLSPTGSLLDSNGNVIGMEVICCNYYDFFFEVNVMGI